MRLLRSSALWVAAAAWAQAPADTASVAGSVTQAMTGAPVERAHVTLHGGGKDAKDYGGLTTAEGKFSIVGIAPGVYGASVERTGFFMPAEPNGRMWVTVILGAGDKKEGLKLRLAPLGSISGRVVGAEGEPEEGVMVSVDTGLGNSGAISVTDDQGQFRLSGLRPGKYRLKAAITPAQMGAPEIRTDGTSEIRYIQTYYGGATDSASAARIAVGTGGEVNGIEIRLARAPMVRITGRVDGVPADPRSVRLTFHRVAGGRSFGGVKKDGTFEVWNVDPGKYVLTAMWTNGSQRVQTAPVDIEVGQSNIDHVELRTIAPSDLSGMVVFEDEQARPQAVGSGSVGQAGVGRSRLELLPVEPGMGINPVFADVGEDGGFQLQGVAAARYRVALLWPTAYVKTVTLGSNPAEGDLLNLRHGAAGAALSVTVSSAFGSIAGQVLEGDSPAPGALVALVRDDFVWMGDAAYTAADATGAYRFPRVRPGSYRIAAIDGNDMQPRRGYLDDYEDVLARLDVRPGDKLTQDLKRHPPVR